MKTTVIQIGNSDGKLRRDEWLQFLKEAQSLVEKFALQIHFCGVSNYWEPWQNAAWVFVPGEGAKFFEIEVCDLARKFRQDCIAVTRGETSFCYA